MTVQRGRQDASEARLGRSLYPLMSHNEQNTPDHVREFGSPIEAKTPGWRDFLAQGIRESGDSQDHVRQPALQGEIVTGRIIPGRRQLTPGWREAEDRAWSDPAVRAAGETGGFRAERDAFEVAMQRELETAGVVLRQPDLGCHADFRGEHPNPDASLWAAVMADPRVMALNAALREAKSDGDASERRTYGRIAVALETAHAESYARVVRKRQAVEEQRGTVLTPDARRWLSGLVELNGVEAVCAKFGVSPEIIRRLIEGVPTPPTWREVPPEVKSSPA